MSHVTTTTSSAAVAAADVVVAAADDAEGADAAGAASVAAALVISLRFFASLSKRILRARDDRALASKLPLMEFRDRKKLARDERAGRQQHEGIRVLFFIFFLLIDFLCSVGEDRSFFFQKEFLFSVSVHKEVLSLFLFLSLSRPRMASSEPSAAATASAEAKKQSDPLDLVREAMKAAPIKSPSTSTVSSSDRCHRDECVYSFDTPFSPGGLYVNLSTWQVRCLLVFLEGRKRVHVV